MSCKYHFNWTTDTPCPYCRIEELERENERDRCHGRDFIRLWKEGKERIAELEQQLAHKQEQCDQLAHQVLELEQQLSRYQGGVEVEGRVCMQEYGASIPGLSTILLRYPSDVRVLVIPKEVE